MDTPSHRTLRGYAFDPSLSQRLDTHRINQVYYKVPWETIDYSDGTIRGEYVEIIDYDPSISKFYESINFDEKAILANDGLDPSESNPKFHQQMVYAVVMTTIKNFERALGRKIMWSTRKLDYNPEKGKKKYEDYVDRLRIYPHALREANAYYSPLKKALLFGYFHSNPVDQKDQMPGTLVFTCLSHDIIAHETTHAILDGLHRYYNEPTNPDVLAFHEAFADIVALFQHFSFPDVLKHQIASTRGDLTQQNLLGELAQQFGVAIGGHGSLRNAIGSINENTGVWERKQPDPSEYQNTLQPHDRGSILVAAVFDAFLSIYERRVADLNRIASNGTGILPLGELHPDLVNRLSTEASKTSQHILYMCIRALDYCPPVDITFGDYLRAIITADTDLIAEDVYAYRLAFIEAFKKRGIYPSGVRSLSSESLKYPTIKIKEENNGLIKIVADFLRMYANIVAYHPKREAIYEITYGAISGSINTHMKQLIGYEFSKRITGLHQRINVKFTQSREFKELTGLIFGEDGAEFGIRNSRTYPRWASFSIQNLRVVSRVGPNGNKLNQVVFSIIQKSGVIIENDKVKRVEIPDRDKPPKLNPGETYYIYKGGCTLILDLDSRKLKYAIKKPLIVFPKNRRPSRIPELNTEDIEKQFKYIYETNVMTMSEFQRYFSAAVDYNALEPFAMLHQH
ncbi:hypothetical protein [Winogradskyella sp. 3972H.M.0a.05]|uniref:hypothetical protein n=1 Tax=Winogradskyella sp. 3972H.M.0a.05 TaxID=2950277 RepID=UPI0033911A99